MFCFGLGGLLQTIYAARRDALWYGRGMHGRIPGIYRSKTPAQFWSLLIVQLAICFLLTAFPVAYVIALMVRV